MKFKLKGSEFIELISLLKYTGMSETGGQAKMMVDDGLVKVNGKQESRKRAKIRSGDIVEVDEQKILVE